MRARYSLVIAAGLLATSCGTSPPLRTMTCSAAIPPSIDQAADGKGKATTLKVLTFNIEGLGFPARKGREKELGQIGARLAAMRAAGTGPDVVMFQEMFSGAAKNAVAASGYPAIASGPGRTTRSTQPKPDKLPGKSRAKRGELGIHFAGSGLAIASRYPIIFSDLLAYGTRACAGLDCLANKGIMLARIVIPGIPTPIDLYNTHMNSRGASKAPAKRNLAAHDRQALEASQFIDTTHDDAFPVIFGGDFNMRHSEPRWENFSRYQSLSLVHRVCADKTSGCDVRMSW
ncbi:MAG: endonuclease/exonuclease/phosphatase family protein, partial [Sphingomicrobium sp.]